MDRKTEEDRKPAEEEHHSSSSKGGGGRARDARLDSKTGRDRQTASRAKVEARVYSFNGDGAADSSGPAEAAWTAAEDSNLPDPAPDQGEQIDATDPPLYPERKQVPRRMYFMGPDAMSQAQ